MVEAPFGAEIDPDRDLYLRTHAHSLQHGPGCEPYPSPTSPAPPSAVLAEQLPSHPEVILDTGTGIDYATVLIAEASPRSRLFPVERAPSTVRAPNRRPRTPAFPTVSPSSRR